MINYIKESIREFSSLPKKMKIFLVGWLCLVALCIAILFKHNNKRPTKLEKARIEVKKDSSILKDIQNEKDSINNAFTNNADSVLKELYSKHGIEVIQ